MVDLLIIRPQMHLAADLVLVVLLLRLHLEVAVLLGLGLQQPQLDTQELEA